LNLQGFQQADQRAAQEGVDSSKMKRKIEYFKSEAGLRNSAAADSCHVKTFVLNIVNR